MDLAPKLPVLYPLPACFYPYVYLNLIFKWFSHFMTSACPYSCKWAPWLMALLLQGAFVPSSACSLPQDPKAEVRWLDFFPAPVKPVLPLLRLCWGNRHCPCEWGVSSWLCQVVLQCAWWAISNLRSLALGPILFSLDSINEQEQQRPLVKWLNSWLGQLLTKWCVEAAFCIVVDRVHSGIG